MGWFSNKKVEEKKEVPKRLPELPKLPALPEFEEQKEPIGKIHQLPSFPSSSIGDKFSRNTIKHVITGKKGGEEEDDFESEDEKLESMQQLLKKPSTREYSSLETGKIPGGFREAARMVRKAEPVFIRIDKFEESLKIFENAKRQISEIEDTLEDINKIKEEEERELRTWESEIKKIKEQIENVDKDIFSKIE